MRKPCRARDSQTEMLDLVARFLFDLWLYFPIARRMP